MRESRSASSTSQPKRPARAAPEAAVGAGEVPEVAAPRTLSVKGMRTRARLIDAAKTVFERDGFLEARIIDITATAQVAPGTFYHYFESKEEIFREVAQAQEQRLTAAEAARAADDAADASIWERIRRSNRRYLERYREEAALMGVIEQVSRYDAQVNAARIATMKHFVSRAERTIRRLQREGAADSRLDPSFAADALGAMVARLAELWLVQNYRHYDFEEAVEQMTLLWANALGLRPEPPAPGPGRSS